MTNALITGGTGYLGGDLLVYLKENNVLPSNGRIYALVRNSEQGKKVEEHYSVTPLILDLDNEDDITKRLIEHDISIVFYMIDSFNGKRQLSFVRALAQVKKNKPQITATHFLHASGAKLFSAFTGMPSDAPLSDASKDLLELQKTATPPSAFSFAKTALETNSNIVELGEKLGVQTYIFAPCIVYGESATFGNKISIQTKAIVQAAKGTRKLRTPDNLNATWPVCHVRDNTTLFAQLLNKMMVGDEIPHGRNGYYLASPGSVAWNDIYAAAAPSLAARGVIDSPHVGEYSDEWVEKAAKVLDCSKEMVSFQMGGRCTFTADNGRKIGWKPKFAPEHILEAMDAEVELILKHI